MTRSACPGCGAPITRARTRGGADVRLDHDADPGTGTPGRMAAHRNPTTGAITARRLATWQDPYTYEWATTDHDTTCTAPAPQAPPQAHTHPVRATPAPPVEDLAALVRLDIERARRRPRTPRRTFR